MNEMEAKRLLCLFRDMDPDYFSPIGGPWPEDQYAVVRKFVKNGRGYVNSRTWLESQIQFLDPDYSSMCALMLAAMILEFCCSDRIQLAAELDAIEDDNVWATVLSELGQASYHMEFSTSRRDTSNYVLKRLHRLRGIEPARLDLIIKSIGRCSGGPLFARMVQEVTELKG